MAAGKEMKIMNKTWPLLIAVASLVATAGSAEAGIVDERRWDVCGGNWFNTCASVHVSIDDANKVTMQVWNLSGREYLGENTYGATVFTKIGFFNAGSALIDETRGLSMFGPARSGDSPSGWVLGDNNNAGGISLELAAAGNDGNSSVDNAISNNCLPGELPGGNNDLWQNPCVGPGDPLPGLADAGWITIEFYLTSDSDWDLQSSDLLIMGQNGPDGESTQCLTGENCFTEVVPEPLTMALLGTGLVGLGGVGAVNRRRRREEEDEAA